MTGQTGGYAEPLFSITIVKSPEGRSDQYQWTLEMSADDSKKQKKLRYKGMGLVSLHNDISDKFLLEVHEKGHWAKMPDSERDDLRKRISSVVLRVFNVIAENGH